MKYFDKVKYTINRISDNQSNDNRRSFQIDGEDNMASRSVNEYDSSFVFEVNKY